MQCVTEADIPPISDVVLSIDAEQPIAKLILQTEHRELPFTLKNGRAYVFVDRIDLYSIIEIVCKECDN